MPQPFDYTIDMPDPTTQLLGALKTAEGIQTLKSNRAASERAALMQQQLQADLARVGENPTSAQVSQLMVKYPQLSENFKRSYDALSADEQRSRMQQASGVYAALEAGENEIARDLMLEQAEAYRNAGRGQDAKVLEDLARVTELNPETAKTSTGLFLAVAMGPDKFADTFTKLQGERRTQQLQPSEMTKAQADALKAAVAANFAESEAALDLQKKGWDITKIQEDIKIAKENTKIAALNAQIQRETNELKKQELEQKLEDAKRKRAEEIRTKTSELASYQASIDNSVSTIDRLLQNPELNNILGAVEGSKFYPSTLVGLVSPFSNADQRADAMADLETIQSQSFLNNLMQAKAQGGTFGSLTEKEGERLVGAVQSLKTKQSEAQFRNNLGEIQRLLMKSREAAAKKFGIPGTIPDTPNVEATPDDITSITDYYLSGEGASGVPYRPQGQ